MRKAVGKKAVDVAYQSEEERSLISKNDSSKSSLDIVKGKRSKKQAVPKRRRPSCWSLLTNFNFLFFVSNCFTPIGVFVWWWLMPESDLPYIIAGVLGLLITLNGMRAVSRIVSLMNESNKFAEKNREMAGHHGEIKRQVDSLKRANSELGEARDGLRASNRKNKENMQNMLNLQQVMSSMDVQDFESMKSRVNGMVSKWHSVRIQNERTMLNAVFDRFEKEHNIDDGWDESQFNAFVEELPFDYKSRFQRLGTFEKLSGKNGRMEYADFKVVMDLFAEMVVDDTDMELEIAKKEKKSSKFRLFGGGQDEEEEKAVQKSNTLGADSAAMQRRVSTILVKSVSKSPRHNGDMFGDDEHESSGSMDDDEMNAYMASMQQ